MYRLLYHQEGMEKRAQWITLLREMTEPVIDRFVSKTIKEEFPIRFSNHLPPHQIEKHKRHVFVELFARTLLGVSPLFQSEEMIAQDGSQELFQKTLEMIRISFSPGFPGSPGTPKSLYLPFYEMDRQLMVEIALILLAFTRVPYLWQRIEPAIKTEILNVAYHATTQITPHPNNWLLFQALIDLFLTKHKWRGYNGMQRVMANLVKIEGYYVGDGWYKDGHIFHMDYYNSFVIHPFLVDIYKEIGLTQFYQRAVVRMYRHVEFLERLIGPNGTYPIFGRSAVYRTGVFHALAYLPFHHRLNGGDPSSLSISGIRDGLWAVLEKSYKSEPLATTNFGTEWKYLTFGFSGEQPGIADPYSNSGSVYYALLAFAPVGLPATHPFWTTVDSNGGWTQKRAWSGGEIPKDSAITY